MISASDEEGAILLLAACIEAEPIMKKAWEHAYWAVRDTSGRSAEFANLAALYVREAKAIVEKGEEKAKIATRSTPHNIQEGEE